MKISPRDKLILTIVGVVVLVGALFALAVFPQFGKMSDLGTQIATASDDVDSAEALLEQRRQSKDRAAFTDTTLIELANAVPENPELPGLIIDLQDAAYDSGVTLWHVLPSDPIQPAGQQFVAVPLQCEIYGSWEDTIDFMNRVAKLTRQVRIARIESEQMPPPELLPGTYPAYSVNTLLYLEAYAIPAAATEGATSSEAPPAPAPAEGQ